MGVSIKEIVIASYLHDVGKFAQRADRKDLYDKNMEGQLCKPTNDGHYGYQHTVFTFGFLEKYRDILPDDVSSSDIIRLAANHHTPTKYSEWIIAKADRLSSGSDRCVMQENEAYFEDPAKFYEKPLEHILASISIDDRKNERAYCKLLPLEEDAILSTSEKKINKEKYNALFQKFEADFALLKGLNYDDFVFSLDSLLERYWWCIPSATNCDVDISLYQHAKTTAAFAATLYAYHKQTNSENENALNDNSAEKFRFLKGDVSGIQKYIFDLKSNSDSSKLLRARSFEIAALGDIIARNIVSQFDMPNANILTAAGGNFMLLLPNTEHTIRLLQQIQLETEEYFLKEFAGKLAVIISDGIKACQDEMQQKNAQKLINDIGYNADCAKQKKMQNALKKNGAVLDEFYEKLQRYGECSQCGIFPAQSDGGICKNCETLAEIGGKLVKASYVSYNAKELKSFAEMVNVREHFDYGNPASVNKYIAGKPIIHLPYLAPWKNKYELFTFSEIAQKATGNKKLAMFKSDIDNLGLVFSSSLGERMSFSRYADMSHKLHYFFSAYYTHFVRTHGYEDKIYTVFSGGDDLCILGAWDAVMQFACDFQKEIGKLTNNNPSVTLSGGIVLSSASTPVRMIAEMAENELEKSKARKDEKGEIVKNAITVFGTTVSWETYEKCLEDGKRLQKYLESEKLSTGVVYKMIDFASRSQKVKSGDIGDLLRPRTWKSNFRYVVVRNVEDEEARNWLLGFGTSEEKIISFRIAVCYALYTQRGSRES